MNPSAFAPALSRRSLSLVAAFLGTLSGTAIAQAENRTSADGPGGTYDLLRLNYTVEVPDCGHSVDHITEAFDEELGIDVFVFHAHVDEDDDRCKNFDRQRTEIRAKASDIVASEGQTVHYRWLFRLPDGFQGSPNFTHIFQIKSNAAAPVMTLTPRTDSFAIDGRIGERGKTSLAPFIGAWVAVDLSVLYSNTGFVDASIRRLSDGEILFAYSGEADTWDDDQSGHDSKFGIYRSLNSSEYLRDEEVRFAEFCASKVSLEECELNLDFGTGGSPGTGGSDGSGGNDPVDPPRAGGTSNGNEGGSEGGGSSGTLVPSSGGAPQGEPVGGSSAMDPGRRDRSAGDPAGCSSSASAPGSLASWSLLALGLLCRRARRLLRKL